MRRLEALASVIVPAHVIADVGCDHGMIAGYCARSGIAERVVASDISEACLDKARRSLDGCGNVDFVCCDGIGYECDEAVIAGMGGLLICDILERANKDGRLPETLVVMPHRDAPAVRRKLAGLGYFIEVDFITAASGRFYPVMRAVKRGGAPQSLDELQYLFGVFYTQKSDVMRAYLIKQYNTYAVAPERNAEKLVNLRAALRFQERGGDYSDI